MNFVMSLMTMNIPPPICSQKNKHLRCKVRLHNDFMLSPMVFVAELDNDFFIIITVSSKK